jgi:predicted dehydrogenase
VLAGLSGVEVTVIESRRDRLREAAVSFPDLRLAACLDEVEGSLDAVVIATPPRSHTAIALQAIQAGLHTLIEKPMATSVADAEALVDAAAASGVTLMVGHTFEHHAAIWKIKQIIRSGELGRILYIDTARLLSGPGPRDDCNVIWDLAPHDIAIASYLLDELPATVSVRAQRTAGKFHADIAYLRMDFPGAAAPAFVHVSWHSSTRVRRVAVVGDRKMVVYNDLSDNEPIHIYDVDVDPTIVDGGVLHATPITSSTGAITSAQVQFDEPLLVQDSHFIECVRTGRPPESSGERGLGVVKVLAATDEAVASGSPAAIRPPAVDSIPARVIGTQAAS